MFILLLSRLLFFQSDLLLESTGVLKIHFQSLKIQNFFYVLSQLSLVSRF